MKLQVPARGVDRVVVLLALEMRIGRHDQALTGPFRIGILLVEIGEFLGRAFEVTALDSAEALVVDLLGRNFRHDLHLVFASGVERVQGRDRVAAGERYSARKDRQRTPGSGSNALQCSREGHARPTPLPDPLLPRLLERLSSSNCRVAPTLPLGQVESAALICRAEVNDETPRGPMTASVASKLFMAN
jgi:hypothetical protein